MAAVGFSSGVLLTTLVADDDAVHPPKFPWSHRGPFSALDHMRFLYSGVTTHSLSFSMSVSLSILV